MDRIILMIFIGLLFATTLFQAREIGKQGAKLEVLDVTLKHKEEMVKIRQDHQTERDRDKIENGKIIQGLKNDIIQMASDFEEKGLADPIALGDRESEWLNSFMRRNSSDSDKGSHIPPTDSAEAPKADN